MVKGAALDRALKGFVNAHRWVESILNAFDRNADQIPAGMSILLGVKAMFLALSLVFTAAEIGGF